MGMEEIPPSHNPNRACRDCTRSTHTNDHSNPQQGTGAMKATVQMKQDTIQEVKNEPHPFVEKSSDPPSSNYVEDNRKLFVGGLPTDITDPEFQDFFSQFGELEEALVMFDRNTGRSRGFGFVTYVTSDVSKSLLQMGDQGNGIGRLVIRGKTCEVKSAAPKGRAPTRGGKANRGYRGCPRNDHKAQVHQMPPFAHTEQFPVMYQSDGYNLPFHRGVYASTTDEYHALMSHPTMAFHGHSQPYTHPPPHGSGLFNADRDPRDVETAGAPYFLSPPLETNLAEHFSVPNIVFPANQIPAYFYQQYYGFIPFVPGLFHPAHPVMERLCDEDQGTRYTAGNRGDTS